LRRDVLDQRVERLSDRLSAAWKMAGLVHPERPLSKGYVRVTSRAGATLTSASDARNAALLTLRFGDGSLDAAVEGAASPRSVERQARRPYIALQPGLFDPAEE